MDEKIDFEPLNYLFNASDKQTISKAFQEAFRCRFSGLSDIRKKRWCSTFEIGKKEIDQLFGIVLYLINTVLYHNINDANQIINLFPSSFNDKLKKGITIAQNALNIAKIVSTLINNSSNNSYYSYNSYYDYCFYVIYFL
eukprot:249874_1